MDKFKLNINILHIELGRFLHMPWHHKSHVPGMFVLGSNFAYR